MIVTKEFYFPINLTVLQKCNLFQRSFQSLSINLNFTKKNYQKSLPGISYKLSIIPNDAIKENNSLEGVQIKELNCIYGVDIVQNDQLKINKLLSTIQLCPHKNLVNLENYSYNIQGNYLFIYEIYSKRTLFQGLLEQWGEENNGLKLFDLLRQILLQIMDGLEHLHHIGIHYGQLVPNQILFLENTTIKLTDIGQSIVSSYMNGNKYKNSIFFAPELTKQPLFYSSFNSDVNYYASDSWSIGILLSVLFLGISPFPSWFISFDLFTVEQLDNLIAMKISPTIQNPSVSFFHDDLLDLLTKLLQFKPENRCSIQHIRDHAFFQKSSEELLQNKTQIDKIALELVEKWKLIEKDLHFEFIKANSSTVKETHQISSLKPSPLALQSVPMKNFNSKSEEQPSQTDAHINSVLVKLFPELFTYKWNLLNNLLDDESKLRIKYHRIYVFSPNLFYIRQFIQYFKQNNVVYQASLGFGSKRKKGLFRKRGKYKLKVPVRSLTPSVSSGEQSPTAGKQPGSFSSFRYSINSIQLSNQPINSNLFLNYNEFELFSYVNNTVNHYILSYYNELDNIQFQTLPCVNLYKFAIYLISDQFNLEKNAHKLIRSHYFYSIPISTPIFLLIFCETGINSNKIKEYFSKMTNNQRYFEVIVVSSHNSNILLDLINQSYRNFKEKNKLKKKGKKLNSNSDPSLPKFPFQSGSHQPATFNFQYSVESPREETSKSKSKKNKKRNIYLSKNLIYYIGRNKEIKDCKVLNEIINYMKENASKINSISLINLRLQKQIFQEFSSALCLCKNLKNLNLSSIQASEEQLCNLFNDLYASELRLQILSLVDIGLNHYSIRYVLNYILHPYSELQQLNISDNQDVGDYGISLLSQALSIHRSIHSLYFWNISLTSKLVNYYFNYQTYFLYPPLLCSLLQFCQTFFFSFSPTCFPSPFPCFSFFYFSFAELINKLNRGMYWIGEIIERNNKLRLINIDHNVIGISGLVKLENSLIASKSYNLTYLYYKNNNLLLCDQIIEAIETLLLRNKFIYKQILQKKIEFNYYVNAALHNEGYFINYSNKLDLFSEENKQKIDSLLKCTKLSLFYTPDNLHDSLGSKTRRIYQTNEPSFTEDQLIEYIPEIFEKYKLNIENRLKSLIIQNPKIRKLPETLFNNINEYEQLTELNLSDNGLSLIPKNLQNLIHLVKLNLSSNQITKISKKLLLKLTALKMIDLRNNKIENINLKKFAEIISEIRVDKFYFHNNPLHPALLQIYQCFFEKKSDLNLANLQLNSIPKDIIYLVDLKILQLSNNNLEAIPPYINTLTNLQYIYLANNHFKSIEDLVSLQYINNVFVTIHEFDQIPLNPLSLGNRESRCFSLPPPHVLINIHEEIKEYVDNQGSIKLNYFDKLDNKKIIYLQLDRMNTTPIASMEPETNKQIDNTEDKKQEIVKVENKKYKVIKIIHVGKENEFISQYTTLWNNIEGLLSEHDEINPTFLNDNNPNDKSGQKSKKKVRSASIFRSALSANVGAREQQRTILLSTSVSSSSNTSPFVSANAKNKYKIDFEHLSTSKRCSCFEKHKVIPYTCYKLSQSIQLRMWDYCQPDNDFCNYFQFSKTSHCFYFIYLNFNDCVISTAPLKIKLHSIIDYLQVIYSVADSPHIFIICYNFKPYTENVLEKVNVKINKLLNNLDKSVEVIFYAELLDDNVISLINNVIASYNQFSSLIPYIPDFLFKLESLLVAENNFHVPPLVPLSDLPLFSSILEIPSEEPKKVARTLNNLGN